MLDIDEQKNILVFDTATTACTVALKTVDGVFSRHKEQANIHSQALLTMIDELLVEAVLTLKDVDFLVVGIGPGSFTGLRIGIGVAQGLAYSNQIKLIPISTLEMIALNDFNNIESNNRQGVKIVVAHDARMSEIYLTSYIIENDSRLNWVGEVLLLSPKDVVIPSGEVHLCGNAWAEYQNEFNDLKVVFNSESMAIYPNAEETVIYIDSHLSEFEVVDWQQLEPVYVRNDVAKKAKIKR